MVLIAKSNNGKKDSASKIYISSSFLDQNFELQISILSHRYADVDYVSQMQHYALLFMSDLPKEIASYETLFLPFTAK